MPITLPESPPDGTTITVMSHVAQASLVILHGDGHTVVDTLTDVEPGHTSFYTYSAGDDSWFKKP